MTPFSCNSSLLKYLSRYASRVKLITNSASKNSESKEISRLKGIIAKLKKGENVGEAEDVEDGDEDEG